MKERARKQATFGQALFILVLSIGILMVGIIGLKQDPQIPLLLASIVCVIYAVYLGVTWKEIEEKATNIIGESIQAMIIIMLIGMLVGSWMACGTVPYIIFWGLKILSPSFFLVASLIICSIMSMATGSSWTTMGTIGVALMGVGYGLGVPVGVTAGAIVCGAYFGDKQSPLSDTSNFAAAVAKVDIYDCVKSMIWSTGPALIVSAVIFTIIGFQYSGQVVDTAEVDIMLNGIASAFTMNPLLLLPPVVLITLVVKKVPAIPGMIAGILLGVILAVTLQGETLGSALSYLMSGFVGNTGIEKIDTLLTRGGMNSMMFTVSLMFVSLFMAALLEITGVTYALLAKLTKVVNNLVGLVTTTIISGIVLNYFAADPYLATLLPARTFAPAYDKLGLKRTVLSRTIQDGGIVFAPLVPWGSNGIYAAAVLGVPVLTYLPYYFMYLTPIFSIICAATGIGIWYTDGKEKKNKKNLNAAAEIEA